MAREGSDEELARADALGRKAGVGCLTFFLGGVSGGIIAVLFGMMYAFLTRAPKCADVPLCNWPDWWKWGALLGAISLPILVLSRLGRPKDGSPKNTDRG